MQAEAYDVLMEAWVSVLSETRAAVSTRRLMLGGQVDASRAKESAAILEAAAWAVYEASVQARLVDAATVAANLAAHEVLHSP